MAEQEQEQNEVATRLEIPTGRVKRIMKLDKDINKVNSEALRLVTLSTELFLRFLAERSGEIALEKKQKTVKLEHLVSAVKRHRPTSDFLLDSLPLITASASATGGGDGNRNANNDSEKSRSRHVTDKPLPPGTRRVDEFFAKPACEAPVEADDS